MHLPDYSPSATKLFSHKSPFAMVFDKILKHSIMDTLDHVWSETGISPSKKTRKSILKAAEKISNEIEEDFKKARKKQLLTRWTSIPTLQFGRRGRLHDPAEVIEPASSVHSIPGLTS